MEGFANFVVKDIDSISKVALPISKDFTKDYVTYEGVYVDNSGKKLLISQKDNRLFYIWDNRDLRNFFSLRKIADDYFSAFPLQILFVRNENGEVI